MIRVLASGYFDPIHVGHIEYLKMARELGDYLIVAVNTNESTIRKKGYFFMDQKDRIEILKSLRFVDEVISVIDHDDTVAETINAVQPDIFAKGGDRHVGNLPQKEIDVCTKNNIKIITGLGKKIESSSGLINRLNELNKKKWSRVTSFFTGCGGWIWTCDLRVMSPTSFRAALPRDIYWRVYYRALFYLCQYYFV